MWIKRDPDFEVQEDFKLRVRLKLEPTNTADMISLDGKVFGWAVRDQLCIKVLIASKGDLDAQECLTKLHGLLGSSVDAHTYKLGEETVSITDTLELGKHKLIYVPSPNDFSLDDMLVLYIKARSLGVKLIYSEADDLYELTGLNPQAAKIS